MYVPSRKERGVEKEEEKKKTKKKEAQTKNKVEKIKNNDTQI